MPEQPKLVVLLTDTFPCESTEPYLQNEIKYIKKGFDKLIIIPLNNHCTQDASAFEVHQVEKAGRLSASEYLYLLWQVFLELPKLLFLPKPLHQLRYFTSYLLNCGKTAEGIINKLELHKLGQYYSILIYCYWFRDQALVGGLIKRRLNARAVSRAHGFEIFADQNLYGYSSYLPLRLKLMNRVYSVSKFGAEYLKHKSHRFTNKVSTKYLGTDDHGVGPFDPSLTFSIATCSIIRDVKRLELLPEILKFLDFDIVWHVIGNGPDETLLREKCNDLPGNIRVQFHGYLSPEQVMGFYKSTSVNLFCSLSRSEGLPVSMMEAISYGIPVLSTEVGGCAEICNENTGILISKDFDPKSVSEQIQAFKTSAKNTMEFRTKVRTFWKSNFNAEQNYQDFVNTITIERK